MLNHIGQNDVAEKIQNAWLTTIESGIHTYDIYKEGTSKLKVGTSEFADAVIANLGKTPSTLKQVTFVKGASFNLPKYKRKPAAKKDLVGVDLFVHWSGSNPDELAAKIQLLNNKSANLSMVTNRGIKVWPEGFEETFCTDHWRCRFKPTESNKITKQTIFELLKSADDLNIDVVKTENLYEFDGKAGYSLGQGQ
jgi:isocitrate dehydrogenase